MRKIFITFACCLLCCITASATTVTGTGVAIFAGNSTTNYDGFQCSCGYRIISAETSTSVNTVGVKYGNYYYCIDGTVRDSSGKTTTSDTNRVYKNCIITAATQVRSSSSTPGSKLSGSLLVCNHGYNTTWITGIPLAGKATIEGGTYTGREGSCAAINSAQVTVNKGTIVDYAGHSSSYVLGPDSESQVVLGDNKTITTVKLSNPPVIIDWADFPG